MAKIIGNTTATPNPRPDWAQTDETKADYIKNKPNTGKIFEVSNEDGILTLKQSDAMCEEGKPGNDGITPHIGENGNWYIGEADTGIAASGGSEVLVVQTTGDSETAVMSQKATTNAIQEAVSDVNSAFDVRTSPNLLNMETATIGTGMAANGKTYSGAGYLLTDYIPVNEGDILTYQCVYNNEPRMVKPFRWVCAFNENKEILSAKGSNTPLDAYTVPSEVAYVRLTCSSGNQNVTKENAVVKGTELLPYESYGSFYILKESAINEEFIKNIVDEANANARPLALPSKIYSFVGYPISIYFRNVMDYHPNDVYVRKYGAATKGKQYADRWEYTPTTAETVQGSIMVYDHNYKRLNNQTIPVEVKDNTIKDSLSVLVIGDSTVDANHETQKMLDLATADGYDLTLLGTRGTSPNLHEGRSGWRASMYVEKAENNPFYNPDTATFDFSYYMTQQGYSGVDCVFIQLGINDMFAAQDGSNFDAAIDTFISGMDTMVNSIHSYDTNIKVVINLIIPCGTDQDAFTADYNLSQTTWRCKKNTYEANIALLNKFKGVSNVYLSPFNAAIDTENNLGGDVHPNPTGYKQLGTQMYSYMRAIN